MENQDEKNDENLIKKDNEKDIEQNEQNREYHYIYFNEIHDTAKEIKFEISNEYEGCNTLEKFDGKNPLKSAFNPNTDLKIYRFKLFPDIFEQKKENLKIKLNIEQQNEKCEFIFNLEKIDIHKDYYEYDLDQKIINIDFVKTSYEQKLEIYNDFILNFLKKTQNSKENEEFILSTLKFIVENNLKYTFYFYMLIFKKCSLTKLLQKHILLFDPEKISERGNFPEKEINLMRCLLINRVKKAKEIIIDNEEEREKIIQNFYFIILYFNHIFNREEAIKMLENDEIFEYLSPNLLTYPKYLTELNLTNNQGNKLIKKAENFTQISNTLSYLRDSFKNFIQVILVNFDFICKIVAENKNENIDKENLNLIKIDNYINPNPKDNLEEIFTYLSQIIILQNNKKKQKILKFNPDFFVAYVNYNYNTNLDNLLFLKEIINIIKKTEEKFEFQLNLNQYIHETGLKLIEEKKLNNDDILNLIGKDTYYNDKAYEKDNVHRTLKVFDGIDILKPLNINTWKTFDFYIMFKNQIDDFAKKIVSFVKHMKDFGILYDLFNFDKLGNIPNSYITELKKKYKELFKTYSVKGCPNFIDDSAKLIYLIHKNNSKSIKDFLIELQNLLDINMVNKILIKLSEQEIPNDLKKKIVDFFTKEKNAKPTTLIFLINNCKKLRKDIFRSMDKYILTEKDLFDENDNDNFIILKGLMDNKIIEKNYEKIGEKYIVNTMKLLSEFGNKLENYEISYYTLNKFINNKGEQNDKEVKLLEIIYYIYILDKEKAKRVFGLLKTKLKEVQHILDKYEKMLKYFNMFFPKSKINQINDIVSIIKDITNSKSLKTYDEKYKLDMANYEKYYEEAFKMDTYLQSMFFMQIFKETKKQYENYKNEDKYYLSETMNKFNQIKILFEKDGFTKINQQILEICIRAIKENPTQLKKEIEILEQILNLDENIDINKISEELLLLSQKDQIFNISVSIITFLTEIKIKETNLTSDLKNIINNLKEKEEIEVIKVCKQKLEEYGIDIYFDKDNSDSKYLMILTELNKNKECIDFLFNTSLEDCGKLKELSLESDNNIVSTNDILDMEKCIEFLLDFKQLKENEKTDLEIVNLLKQKIIEKEKIILYFKKYVVNFAQIKTLNSSFSKSENLKNQINAIFKNAIFEILNDKRKPFICIYNNNFDKKELNEEDIKILRDRALISKNNITEEYKYFIEVINETIEINNIMKEIYKKGYPNFLRIIINLRKEEKDGKNIFSSIYLMNSEKKENPNEIKQKLKEIVNKLIKNQKDAYESKPLIRFFYGRKFNLLNNYICLNMNIIGINSFLRYITNDMYKVPIKDFKPEKSPDEIMSNINDCEKYLSEILKINNLSLENIISSTIIKSKEKLEGLYMYRCEKLYINLLQIYKFLTGNLPIAQNVLLCNANTYKDEIYSFMFRAIKCELNSCFIIAGVEFLDYEQTIYMVDLFDSLFNKKEEIKSCIIFLYTNNASDICMNMESKSYKSILPIDETYKKEKFEKDDITLIISDKSGVGKSTQIKKEIQERNKNWIYFPIGDTLQRDNIIDRLKILNIKDNSVIHLDLYDTDNVSLMDEFLFSFLILRYYGKDEDVFYLPKNIEVKIEIPNSFINIIEKFQILKLFKIKEMKISNLSPLIVSKEIDSNIQIVANYLKCLKENKISDYDLIIPNITPEGIKEMSKTPIQLKKPKKKFVTALDAQILSQKECQDLIFELINSIIKDPTYYQIVSFINVLSIQLKKFNQNYFLNAFNLKTSKNGINQMRTSIVKNFIDLTNYFTESAFTNLLKNQKIIHEVKFNNYDKAQENKENENAMNILANDKHRMMTFKEIKSSIVFFHEGVNESFSIITNKNPNDQEYINFLALKNSQVVKKEDILKSLPKYDDKAFKKEKFLKELKDILAVNNPVTKEERIENKSELISFEELTENYVITADNFIKMVLILLRIRSNIPVIMMGETGCGKTSLIRKLSELRNNGNTKRMRIKNIHAGTNDVDLLNFINNDVIPQWKALETDNMKEKKFKQENNMLYEETKLWVFLDEINTCKSMGLISELICKHTCQGERLPDNIVFIAACNPYRKKDNKNQKEEKVGLDANLAFKEKKHLNEKEKEDLKRKTDLVYMVNPLPHSLLNFVFDFGGLEENDEERYIRSIVEESILKIYYMNKKDIKKDDKKTNVELNQLKNLAQEMVIHAHRFIKRHNDKSVVSLREIRRFNIFYEFFYDYLQKRKANIEEEKEKQIFNKEEEIFYQGLNHYESQIYSINLSVFLCYYLRITEKEKREEFVKEMNLIFKNEEIKQKRDFLDIPKREEQFLVNNINLGKGIAKNRALLENIFSLFAAINSKVPIFIVGKPGCSKSLSFQLINKSMQAGGSESTFFRKYPKLLVNPFQGSMASTSKGVEKVFDKARTNYEQLNAHDKLTNISVIFFDEMGLAEHSPNNPLKVIHSKLEYDENEGEKKVAFLGISNWSLDAAKMNRGITISIPDLSEEDNIETSLTIGKSYNENLATRYEQFYKDLGSAYFEYRNYLKDNYLIDVRQDFHGNRDFYHLIKIFTRKLISKEENNLLNDDTLLECAIDSIERNFGGTYLDQEKSSVQKFKEIFAKKYPKVNSIKEYKVLERIKENIDDPHSRYLLLITKGSVSMYLISEILLQKKDYEFYIGSKFENDLSKEDYATKVINKIQQDMENGKTLVFKDLETVYPHMYDLFNQNFTVISGKNYSRIAVGSSTNAFCLVHDNFKCIVNVDEKKIIEEEPPFLNRFEKHIITLEDILDKDLIDLSKEIISLLSDLTICNEEFISINYSLEKLLINCNLDEIQALIYKANLEGKKTKEEIYDFIFSKIALTLPQDIIINMKYGKFYRNNPQYFEKIIKFYKEGEHANFEKFLKSIKNKKNVVYTFSKKMEKIKGVDETKTKKIVLGMLKKENELEKLLDEFFIDDNSIYCLIQLMPNEVEFMNYIKNLIERKEKEFKNKTNKSFIFIIHLFRISKDDIENAKYNNDKKNQEIKKKVLNETLTNLSGFYQIFIDNLNGDENLKIENLINDDDKTKYESCIELDKELPLAIFTAISYIKYDIIDSYKGLSKDNYISALTEYIQNNESLRTSINNCFFRELKKIEEPDVIIKILKSEKTKFSLEVKDIASLIKQELLNIYKSMIYILFFRLEKNQFFSALLSHEYLKKSEIKKENPTKKKEINVIGNICELYLSILEFNYGKLKIIEGLQKNKVHIILGYGYPGIKPILERIYEKMKSDILHKYRENENNLRKILDDEEEETKLYLRKLNIYNSSTINIINREESIKKIIDSKGNDKLYSEELFNLIKHDFFFNFLKKNLEKQKKEKEDKIEEEQIIYDFEDNIKFMDLIFKNRNKIIKRYFKQNENDKDLDIISKLSKLFNFIEAYSSEIIKINQMFLKLSQKIPDLYPQIEEKINNKEIKFEISERNPGYSSVVNEAFFISVDALLRVVITNENIYNFKDEDSDVILSELIKTLKEILQTALSLNNELTLRSKEAVSLQEILKLLDIFTNIKMLNSENLLTTIKYFRDETRYINEGNGFKLCQNFENFIQFLYKKFDKNDNKKFNIYKTLGFIFLNEYLKIPDEEFRKLLFKKILENNDLIKNNSQLFKIIIENVIDTGTDMINNLESINDDESPFWKMINNTKNEFLDEVLQNIFEEKVVSFFDSINKLDNEDLKELFPQYLMDNFNKKYINETGVILDNSFDIFKQVTEFLDNIKDKENQINNGDKNIHLAKLYSIVYIKYYLYKLVYIIKELKKDIKHRESMKDIINYIKNLSGGFSRVIKIYIFKLFYSMMNNNFDEFKVYDFKENWIDFLKDFDSNSDADDNNNYLTYFFLPLDDDDYTHYSEELNLFDMYQKNKFSTATNELSKLIEEYGLDIFLTVSINKIISNLGSKTYIKDKDDYFNFSAFIKSLFENENNELLTYKLKKLLYLLYDSDIYTNKTIKLFGLENENIDHHLFEILLYGFRLCINVLDNKESEKNYLYKSFFEKNYIEALEKSYIPGIDVNEDYHLLFLDEVEYHLKYYKDDYGCYVCDCGYYYAIGPCGFPDHRCKLNCRMCQKPIGYAPKPYDDGGCKEHGMVLREGHYRIFKNEDVKYAQMSRYKENDNNIPNLIFDDYINKIIDPIRKKNAIGFNQISKDFFEKQDKDIRKLSNIGYRLLNYIAYTFLFFGYCSDNISKEKLDKCLIKDMNILKIIEKDWNFLTEALQKKNINSTQIFMNMIFKKLSQKLKQCKFIKKSEERDIFEDEIEKIINECIENYDSYREKYDDKNKSQLKVSNYSFKTILNELVELKEEIYPFKEYPYFKYFKLTKYKTEEDFEKRMPSKEKYFLTSLLLIKVDEFKKLKYLPDFNEFINLMIEEYSFKISRSDAKDRSLNEEIIYKNESFKIKLKKFLKAWKEIKDEAVKYECGKDMPVKSLSDTDKLNYFLNDKGEIGGGMYIAAAYTKFIEWQNTILQPIIDSNPLGGILYNYVDILKKKIPVQEASNEQIVLIDKRIDDSKYSSIKDIIYSFSERNIFSDSGKINYSDYNSFLYDYDSIEEELGRIILPGVLQFDSEKKLNFVVYWSEGFRGGNSEIISKFYFKYKQKDLSEEEKKKIKEYIIIKNKEQIEIYGFKKDFKEIYASLQILIFFLTEHPIQKDDEKISEIISKYADKYFKISNDCKEFFESEAKDITINKLMNLFFIIEHLCFNDLCINLQLDLQLEIPQEQKETVIEKLLKSYNKKLYTLKDLAAAVRRYISRSLVGFAQTSEAQNEGKLSDYLSRQDLWEERVWGQDCDLIDEINRHIGGLNLKISQAYKFYELIGEEDMKEIEFLNEEDDKNKINI